MTQIADWYAELKSWQSGIAALIGFVALMCGALWNFHLNRRRDSALRHEEMLSVATALYGEILLIREEVARLARYLARKHQREQEVDARFVQDHKLRDAILYPALAAKLGTLPPHLVIAITRFHENFQKVKEDLPLLVEDKARGFSYSVLTVLDPARAAIQDVRGTLREIEGPAGIPQAKDPEQLGVVEEVIEWERELFETPTPSS